MRSFFFPVVSIALFALQACAVDSSADPADGSEASEDALTARATPETLLFGLLPEPTIHFGFSERKTGKVDCVILSIAPPGGPSSTTVSCNAPGATKTLRERDAKKVFDFMQVDAKPIPGGGGVGKRKEASVSCVKRFHAPPGGPGTSSTTCTVTAIEPNACPTSEIAFTQATGCQNDGSVEFCIPSGDDDVLDAVKKVSSSIRCAPGGGRARCNSSAQLLCSYPTQGSQCTAANGALSDRAWGEVCRLASLDKVTKIVPTVFE